jgi:hypothetical protein
MRAQHCRPKEPKRQAATRPRQEQRPINTEARPRTVARARDGQGGAYFGESRDASHVPFSDVFVERLLIVKRLRANRAPHRAKPARPLQCE